MVPSRPHLFTALGHEAFIPKATSWPKVAAGVPAKSRSAEERRREYGTHFLWGASRSPIPLMVPGQTWSQHSPAQKAGNVTCILR